jgi:hypothetical protein
VVGPTAARPSAGDALLVSVADAAGMGLQVPLTLLVDLRELCPRIGPGEAPAVRARAAEAGLSRALHGALALAAHFFPEAAGPAALLSPPLSFAERAAVDAVVDAARDPARLRRLRGTAEAARLLLSPA